MLSRPASIKEAKERGLCRMYKSGNSQNTSICREGVCGDFFFWRLFEDTFPLLFPHLVPCCGTFRRHPEAEACRTQLRKSVVYSGLKTEAGIILQETCSVPARHKITAQREKQAYKQLTVTSLGGLRKTQAILFWQDPAQWHHSSHDDRREKQPWWRQHSI